MFEYDEGEKVIISLRNVQKKVIKGLDILATEHDTNRSEYLRRLMYDHVMKELPKEMINRL